MRSPLVAALVLVAALTAARPADACMYAYHHRVFPVAAWGGRWVAAILDLHRGSNESMNNVYWSGEGRVALLAANGTVLGIGPKTTLDHRGRPPQRQRDFLLATWFLSRALPGARTLDPPSVTACHYRSPCGPVTLGFAEGRGLLVETADRPQPVPLDVPAAVLVNLAWAFTDGEDSLEEKQRKGRELLDETGGAFRPVVLRRYAVSGQTLAVIDVSTQLDRYAKEAPVSLPEGGCRHVARCLYPTITPHHGTVADLLVVLP